MQRLRGFNYLFGSNDIRHVTSILYAAQVMFNGMQAYYDMSPQLLSI